ncbi:MAG: iron chaperone [Sphingobacteriales bacterium]
MEASVKFKTVDEYFSTLPSNTKSLLEELRSIIKLAAPTAKEVISYNMPAFKLHSVLVYYAAYKGHIGVYPTSSPIEVFKDDLAPYKYSKGAIQFPLDEPMPADLISRIVKFRVQQDSEQAKKKKL